MDCDQFLGSHWGSSRWLQQHLSYEGIARLWLCMLPSESEVPGSVGTIHIHRAGTGVIGLSAGNTPAPITGVVTVNGRRSDRERFAAAATMSGDDVVGIVLFVDGPIVGNELDNSTYTDDWLTGNPPSSGVWVWEGSGYHSYQFYDGDYSDPSLEGKWRRPTAKELWSISHGRSPWACEVAG